MSDRKTIRLGIMGFGQTGRQLYDLASLSDDIEVVAIADIGEPDILHYLLCSEVENPQRHRLEGNFFGQSAVQDAFDAHRPAFRDALGYLQCGCGNRFHGKISPTQ